MAAIPQQLIGSSPAFLATLDRISAAAAMDQPTIVAGERGTGKSIMAQRLHFLSPRWEQSYVSVNCTALDDEDLLDVLFDRGGACERAEGGTLALLAVERAGDEAQSRILSLLDDGGFHYNGASDLTPANIRVIATTTIDLPALSIAGRFNAALLDRLAFDVITLPPLRQRQADILPLAEYFGRKFAVARGAESFPGFTPEIAEILMAQDWPGNIRQLKVTTERAVALSLTEDNHFTGPVFEIVLNPFRSPWKLGQNAPKASPDLGASDHPAQDSGAQSTSDAPQMSFKDRIFAFERALIDQALAAHNDHQGEAAKSLELSYHAFRGLLRKHGLKK